MARLRPDGSFDLIRRRARPRLGPSFGILVVIAVFALVLSRLGHSYVPVARNMLLDALAPVLSAVRVVADPLRSLTRRLADAEALAAEVDRLRTENEQLRSWEWRAKELERQLADLTRVARVVHAAPQPYVTARVIAASSGLFTHRVGVDAGREHLVRVGYPAVNGEGLVGRVVEAGAVSARIMLLTDARSRVPVQVGASARRALLVGDNSAEPTIAFLSDGASVEAGEEVFTSGVGGLFPRNLPIGETVSTATGIKVRLRANLQTLEYVSILYHASPTLELTDGGAGAGTSRRAAEARPAEPTP